ncbi:helix-turn-helix domain-containing protein [Flavobacterium sp. Fl-318]|uniref:Helix-turn-helix domain-containing protein n=1 Tax=Flavobacterium cupriresistens TaxID=2893885 RepID=A0ABU4RJN9_9FLAO|nr:MULTISPECIES: helix-turn-helix domain-containing protein [unclassified Flavobacterium]MDX6191710.1 helix-turn-helix domain-containing protein [Flavobacterium sp. Fl-318]UFH41654.1 helix-turn-helix domain-containing protein [Flavobacterium sp. F-323]
MKRFNSYYSLNVFRLELDRWEFPTHKHNFYELIFVEKGSGYHIVNEVSFSFKEGDVFLLRPEDGHYFTITEQTHFIFVKFTEQLFVEKLEGGKTAKWMEVIKTLLQNVSAVSGSLVNEVQDKKHLGYLLQILLVEFTKTCTYSREVVVELFGAILMIVARSHATSQYGEQCPENIELDRVNQILGYMRLYALDIEKMRIENIASNFAMSSNYISIYVKKHSGVSIQQHIIQTKLKLADQLLKNSRLNINEIASKLGFTDASHFNKIYKKYRGISPGIAYKNSGSSS